MPVTIMQLAEHRLGRPASTGGDFIEARLPIMGGCEVCGATVAAYNSCPSKSGYIRCANDCIGDDGWEDVVEANRVIFDEGVSA